MGLSRTPHSYCGYNVYYCANQALVREAIIASNQGNAIGSAFGSLGYCPVDAERFKCFTEDVFYVTSQWLTRLCNQGAREIVCPEPSESGSCCVQ